MYLQVYCDNILCLHQISYPISEYGITKRLIQEYDLINEIQTITKDLLMELETEDMKGNQDNAKPYNELPYKARVNCDCDHNTG